MMGKLQASTVPVDNKDVLITDGKYSEPPDIRVVRINTHGTSPAELEADKAIVSSKKDNDKRRTVKLERSKLSSSWGFTLQSYGIYNATDRCIENYTYVDYVEMKSSAFISGMRRSDIIFAVDGQSTENLSHAELVEKIKGCRNNMRMVLVNSNICQKVELHQRRQKLQALLRQKQSELKSLEKRDAAIQYQVKTRLTQKELRRRKVLASDSQTTATEEQKTGLVAENNNVETVCKSPSSTLCQRDVRPKLSAYMTKLSLSPDTGPTAYERTLLRQAAFSRTAGESTTPRRAKRTNADYARSESLRMAKGTSSQSKIS